MEDGEGQILPEIETVIVYGEVHFTDRFFPKTSQTIMLGAETGEEGGGITLSTAEEDWDKDHLSKVNTQPADPDGVLPRLLSSLLCISLRDHSDQRSSLRLKKGRKNFFFFF